ncbi:hypothetical protein CONLIGDRAFT_685163 [Coniochaeta ligniaria NRRL 30616]|uniref:Uncharacterized protein n=1 Tax=Coniochaeta ligniaria NRRL 30616 TaxID=1408157 RepID=A0A1J7J820_9PEZI|nr:hypothetical protein CONLIGDRAFT_685163 [Coniochaeta ligniaria NRRL 30616]
MSFEIPESALLTLRQSVPAPTKGWARVYYLDGHTNAFCIKEVQVTALDRTQTYDTFETDCFQDDVAALGFFPAVMQIFYITFPDHVRSGFRRVVEACRGLAPQEAVDSALQAPTGVSLLSSALMRELLLVIALLCNHFPPRKTPRHAQTIATIASAGPPSTEPLTRHLRTYIDDLAGGGGFLHPRAEAALLRGGWRLPRPGSLEALWGLKEHDFAQDAHLEADARDLLRLLIELDYVQVSPEPDGYAPELLRRLAQAGSVTVLRLLFGDGGVLPVERVPAELRTDMLLNAVAATRDERVPDRRAMISYLLGPAGFDPNGQASHWAGTRPGQRSLRQTALHIAMEGGDTATVNLLLEKGASMDVRDEEGRTPAGRGPLVPCR